MSVEQILSHLSECRHHLSELRARPDYFPLRCALLRMEGDGGTSLYNHPFARVLADRLHWSVITCGQSYSPFSVAFYTDAKNATLDRLHSALATVESFTVEAQRLLSELPEPVQERLVLPLGENWWRTVFHLAWHFCRPFLRASRDRLLTREDGGFGRSEETFVQLHGTCGRQDLLPGLIYSDLEHDICICSEAAIDVLMDALRAYAERKPVLGITARCLTPEEIRVFQQLRSEFETGANVPLGMIEAKLMKLANSFETPPATEWAGLEVGGCVERFLRLSRLNDLQEICQIRGPATDHFCELAARAGHVLPADVFPDRPILFDDLRPNDLGIAIGISGPRPTMNRDAAARWLGFVFATLKEQGNPALQIRWLKQPGPLFHALATIDRNLYAASVLAIDLAGLATATIQNAVDQPRPVPDSIQTIIDPTFRQRATDAWRAASQLRRLMEQWEQWFHQLRATGDADPGLALRMYETVAVCVRSLCMLGVKMSTFRNASPEELLRRFPKMPSSILDPPWQQDEEYHEQTKNLLRAESWNPLLGELLGFLQLLETAPSTALPQYTDLAMGARLYVEGVDNFEKVRDVNPDVVTAFLTNGFLSRTEDQVQTALEQILGVSFHQRDWGGEINDLYTANIVVNGTRRATAFLLKGPGIGRKQMTIADCGKNGDQLVRLFTTPADLFVVQYVGPIADLLVRDVEGKVEALRAQGRHAQFLIMDGQDTARVLRAYGKL